MLRFRFHGRGGQGMKTASRILGTAAFLSGYHAQDTPVYGAERRGAPIEAYTRISKEPIHDRGPIHRPDAVIVADESLLTSGGVRPAEGLHAGGALFLDTTSSEPHGGLPHGCRFIPFDATGLALRTMGLPVLSAIMGAAACKLFGAADAATVEKAVSRELETLHINGSLLARNLDAAVETFEKVPAVRLTPPKPAKVSPIAPAALSYAGGWAGTPAVSRPFNMGERATGSWRVFRPIVDPALCSRCDLCFLACPEGCIHLDEKGYPVIDYVHCKGCLVCEEVCPREGAIEKEREGDRQWA